MPQTTKNISKSTPRMGKMIGSNMLIRAQIPINTRTNNKQPVKKPTMTSHFTICRRRYDYPSLPQGSYSIGERSGSLGHSTAVMEIPATTLSISNMRRHPEVDTLHNLDALGKDAFTSSEVSSYQDNYSRSTLPRQPMPLLEYHKVLVLDH